MHQIRQNARPTSGAIDDRAVRRSTSALVWRAPLVDRAAHRLTSDAIVRRARSSIDERWARPLIAIVNRAARSTIAPLDRRSRSCTAPLVGAVRSSIASLVGAARSGLSLLSLSLSLSLSFSESDLKWKWGEKMISGSKVKILVNRKSFSGKWYFPWQPNTPVLWKMISGNSFHPIQTHP